MGSRVKLILGLATLFFIFPSPVDHWVMGYHYTRHILALLPESVAIALTTVTYCRCRKEWAPLFLPRCHGELFRDNESEPSYWESQPSPLLPKEKWSVLGWAWCCSRERDRSSSDSADNAAQDTIGEATFLHIGGYSCEHAYWAA